MSNGVLYYDPDAGCAPGTVASSGGAPSGQITVGTANIKTSVSGAEFKSELDKVIATNPDFIAGSEWTTTGDKIKRDGYDFVRSDDKLLYGTVAMWNTKKWTKVKSGYERLTFPSDINYNDNKKYVKQDKYRGMSWVTVNGSNGTMTFIATHQMVNPNALGPNDERRALYKKAMDRMMTKIKEFQASGPVVVGGDFNAQVYREPDINQSWHPNQNFKNVGMESTHQALELSKKRGDRLKVFVDQIFYTKNSLKALNHSSPFKLYDHPYLTATLEFQGASPTVDTQQNQNSANILSNGSEVSVTFAQANIKSATKTKFRSAIDLFSSYKPDFIALQEITTAGGDLEYKGYKVFGAGNEAENTSDKGEQNRVRIAWDTAKWKRVDGGIRQIHPKSKNNPISNRDRYALWASFQNGSGAVVSVISTHWNTGSWKEPTERAKTQSANTKALAQELLTKGPVLIGGDFNYQTDLTNANKPYSPKTVLGEIGIKSVFNRPDYNNVYVDWIFHSPQLKVDKQAGKPHVFPKENKVENGGTQGITDHPLLVANFKGTSEGVGTSTGNLAGDGASTETTCNACPSVSSINLIGKDNQEKVFNFFIGKGLSDVQTAGIMGNMAVESGFDPENVQNGTSDAKQYGERTKDPGPLTAGWGLIQWTPGSKVIKAAKDAGVGDQPIHELATQLEIVWGHLQNKPPITKGSFSIPEFKKITDTNEAVRYFEDKIEGAGKPNYTDRYKAAELALKTFGGKSATPSATPVSSTSESGSGCGDANTAGLTSGGMDLKQAQAFMKRYKDLAVKYANKSGGQIFTIPEDNVRVYGSNCEGSALANCSSFSEYFVGKYTKGHQAFPDGKEMVGALLASKSGFIDGGHKPKVYAVFSRQSGGGGHGHTGVVLGMNAENKKMIIGEASCGAGIDGIKAYEVDISEFSSNDYTYAYTDNILKLDDKSVAI
ncbi:MAG TPA: phage tail tip lysozyme [Candidatus Saccharimonadales bacterium]